jgi:phosphoribosyl 1,2-cyclic phosphodiesterase
MKVIFHGSRGSHSIAPTSDQIEKIAKNIFELSKQNPKMDWKQFKAKITEKPHSFSNFYSLHSTCVEIHSPLSPMPIFIDMGTGLSAAAADKKSGLNNKAFKKGNGEAAFFITHTHWDHVIGLPTLFRIHKDNNKFHFYGGHSQLEKRISKLFDKNFFPIPFENLAQRFHFHQLKKEEVIPFGKLKIQMAAQSHPGISFAYRFEENNKSFVVATDTDLNHTFRSRRNNRSNIYTNATLLAVDSHFSVDDFRTRRDHGHPNIEMVVDFAVKENAKNLLLIHHNPQYSDKKLEEELSRAKVYLNKTYKNQSDLKILLPLPGKAYNLAAL